MAWFLFLFLSAQINTDLSQIYTRLPSAALQALAGRYINLKKHMILSSIAFIIAYFERGVKGKYEVTDGALAYFP
ncbi:MAG: hypothetical protein ABII72_00100 [Parcubacteria group bacterium]